MNPFFGASNVQPDQAPRIGDERQFAVERFEHMLERRLQVAMALRQVPTTAASQVWLVRALDGAICDELRHLRRLGLDGEAGDLLQRFRRTLNQINEGRGLAA